MRAATKNVFHLIKLMRVYQWTKNGLVLAALLFSLRSVHGTQITDGFIAFLSFCLASSAVYAFNDLIDIEQDRAHPEKRNRPLPSGLVSAASARALVAGLLAASVLLAWVVNLEFVAALGVYFALTVTYSLYLKHVVILDVLCVALGFVIRAMGGAVAVQVEFTNWLVVCTLFLALFLALSKRRNELSSLKGEAENHRVVLNDYSLSFLDQLILIVAGGAIITYTIYTCAPEVIERTGTDKLYVTIPFVVYGLFRYLFLIHRKDGGGDPSATLLRDIPMALTVLSWAGACALIIYF